MSERSVISAAQLRGLVEEELAHIDGPGRAWLRDRRTAPALRELDWKYGEPDARRACWIFAHDPGTGWSLAYCAAGLGPAFPWGHVFAGDGMGMESQWHSRLAAAAIGARGPAPAPGRAVPDVRERALAYGRRLAAICEGFRGRVGDIDEVLRFIAYNEHAVALDALVSRFIDADADDDPRLELAELEALVVAAEPVHCRREWIDLIVCLSPGDRARLAPTLRALALATLAAEVPRYPGRRAWIERLQALLRGDGLP